MTISFSLETVVMQPTTMCNLDCTYCYLPDRDKNLRMDPAISRAVSNNLASVEGVVEVIWHAGEPLSCGLGHFRELTLPFEELRRAGRITHGIQTNATLITKGWCELFREQKFRVGISVDGPLWANTRRRNWGGKESFQQTMRGIELLREADIPFSAICVIGPESISRAGDIYRFFIEIGCSSLGINIEESLGIHKALDRHTSDEVEEFWASLFMEWQKNPVIHMRDFARMLPSLAQLGGFRQGEESSITPKMYDLFPSVAWNGDVVLLAPEFLNTNAPRYGDFIVGNVLKKPMMEIIGNGSSVEYVRDFIDGVAQCQQTCQYFSVCYGGQAGNKFFEHGTTNATETRFCRNSEQALANGILDSLVGR